MTLENGVVPALRHFEQERLEIFLRFLREESFTKNPPVSLLDRNPLFSRLSLQCVDHISFKISD
jgi:hypothetical protein